MKSILDPSFKYVNAANTDLRATFRRVKREAAEIAKAQAEQAQRERDRARIVTNIRDRKVTA